MRMLSAAWLSSPPLTAPRGAHRSRRSLPCRCHAEREGEDPASASSPFSRRASLAALAAVAAAAAPTAAPPPPAAAAPAATAADALTVEQLFPGASQGALSPDGELRFTHRIYLDVGTCPSGVRLDRRLGDKSVLCTEPQPLGRILLGLYGTVAPYTVANFVAAVRAGAYTGTLFSKVLPGQYIAAGRQGSHRMGYVEPPPGLQANADILDPLAFQLPHRRPGTLSLNLAANEDDDSLRLDRDYRNLNFLITTGPAPVPSLDGENIVFGQVIEGLDVVSAIAAVPTFSPDGKLRAFNEFAKALGDERAARARATWGKPIVAVVITASGVLD